MAVLSDVHGNPIALDAVLADVERTGGADYYMVLGDLVASGFPPVSVLERLAVLPNARFARGNTDRYVVAGTWTSPLPTVADAQANPDLVPALVTVAQGLAWTRGVLSAGAWIEWLGALPLELRMTLPDGTRVLGVHAAPGTDDGEGIEPDVTDRELRRLTAGCNAELVFVGHTHTCVDRSVDGVRAVNVGSVSNPRVGASRDRRATYAAVESDPGGHQVTLRRWPMTPRPSWLRSSRAPSSPTRTG
jgi:predicted phosphodiesterase